MGAHRLIHVFIHSHADRQLIDSVSARQLLDFRTHMFSPHEIASNPARFLNYDTWIDPAALRKYLSKIPPAAPRVKVEPDAGGICAPDIVVKQGVLPGSGDSAVNLRTVWEGGQEVFDLYSPVGTLVPPDVPCAGCSVKLKPAGAV
ncbi:hypothetical protein R3P38DRAFT_3233797 [Favolaschia claudopus]|uniref:Uncharacterized protein n=1 Tax=Favolaschia claudopus TaxID=2862362 RepID=A0AAV9ZIF2_9AGAR